MNELVIERPQVGPQEWFCATRATIAIAGGTFFGGKSISLLMEAGRGVKHPKYRGSIFRRTYPQITDAGGLADIASNIYPQMGAVPTKDRCLWTFPSGAFIKFNHMQHDSDMVNYRSSQFCFLGIDQVEEFPEEAFFYLRARNRPTPGYTGPAYCRCTCNAEPGWLADLIQWWWNPDTGYPIKERSGVIRHFIRKDGRIIWIDENYEEDGIKPISFTFIPSTAKDNPKGLKADPNYESNVATMDAVSVERYLKNNWKVSYSGGMFEAWWFKKIKMSDLPKGIRRMRYWDFAATEGKDGKDPAWTAGVKCGEFAGDFYIIDVKRFREAPGTTEKRVIETAKEDGPDVAIRWEEEKGSAGKFTAHFLSGKLLGFDAQSDPVSGDKILRARPLSAAASNGRVFIVEGPWNDAYTNEATAFRAEARYKDQIDATTGCMKCLCTERRVWPTFSISKAIPFAINWDQTSTSTFVYGCYFQNRSNTVYFLAALWDTIEGKLWVYKEKRYEVVIPEVVCYDAIKSMRLDKIANVKILGNEAFISESGNKSTSRVIGKCFKDNDLQWNPSIPVLYEMYGAINYANALFSTEPSSIEVHKTLIEAVAHFGGWGYKDSDKAPTDGFEYAQCLCLIVSDLRRQMVAKKKEFKIQDYHEKEEPKKERAVWQTA
jgi:predicted phage terminase large subunit-like protein